MEILQFIISIVLGAVAGWAIFKFLVKGQASGEDFTQLQEQVSSLEKENEIKAHDLQRMQQETEEQEQELKEEREKNTQLNRMLSTAEAQNRHLEEKLQEQKSQLEEMQEHFRTEFKNLANEILEEKSKKFTDQNKTSLGELLNPLKERIEKFEEKVEKNSKESLQWNSALKEQISNLKDLNMQITKEAENLTKALRGDKKSQGTWGEMQLEAILEKVGLQKDVHYYKEQNYKNEAGQNQRVDYIIKLPDDKYLVLDSKVSLNAYTEYFNASSEKEQAQHLKQHLDSISMHIKTLSERNYQNLYEIPQPDYVLMFVANEPALTIALKEDQNLYEKALDKNIVLVSTSTLLATLRTISYIWRQDLQNKNALEIARQAGALYDKFISFSDDLKKVGNNLNTTQNAYKDAMKKLYEGKDNLVRKTERLKELGAKTTKQMDQRLLDRADSDT